MKTRKLLALVLAIAMMATIFVIPSAAVSNGAACEILGLLKGEGEGVTAEYLAKGTTRAQGLLITLRARGLEDEALAFTGTDTFKDAATAAPFWAPVLAYAYANPGLGWIGDGDGNFRPTDIMTGAELAKVMLAVLGYAQGEDFEWADLATFAASKGITVAEGKATNDDLAASLVEALGTETKAGEKLVDTLIADGVLTEEKAIEAEVKGTTPAVSGTFAVKVTGAKKITATFTDAQDTDTTVVSLKKGAVGQAITVSWDKAKKVATLSKGTALTKGDYTLTINGEAVNFTVDADETATELVVGASTVYAKDGAQDIKLHLLNQYGEKMTFTSTQMVGGASFGTFALTADGTSANLTLPTGYKVGNTSTIFAYYSPKNFTVNATVTVVADQILATILFEGPIALGDASKKLTRLTEETDGNTLAIKALDQYGNKLKLSDYDATDYSLVVSGADVTPGADKLTLTNLKAGTFTIRAVVLKGGGSISEMYTETIYAKPKLASFDVAIPDALYAEEEADFAVTGVDQYGKAINVDNTSWVIGTMSTVNIIGTPTITTNNINLAFDGKGTFDVHFTKGTLLVVKPVTVQAKKVVASIASIPVSTQAILKGKTVTINNSKVKLQDQYGNDFKQDKLEGTWNWELRRLAADNEPYGVISTGTDATVITLAGNVITAQKKGAEQLRLTLYSGTVYGSTATDYKEFIYDFALSTVEAGDVVAYEFDMADTMYVKDFSTDHHIGIKLIGKTANGTTVTLNDTAALPGIIAQYTVTGEYVAIDGANSKLVWAKDVDTGKTVTTILKAWNNKGEDVAEKTVTLSGVKPVRTSVAMKFTMNDDKLGGTIALTSKDQYGVAYDDALTGKYYSSNTKVLTVNEDTGAVTKVANGTALVRFVSTDGVWAREVSITFAD